MGDIFGMLPFDNKVTLVEVTGQTVWEALENGVDAYPELNGKFPQVSGIQYTFDASKPVGERIVSVTMVDGTPSGSGRLVHSGLQRLHVWRR